MYSDLQLCKITIPKVLDQSRMRISLVYREILMLILFCLCRLRYVCVPCLHILTSKVAFSFETNGQK